MGDAVLSLPRSRFLVKFRRQRPRVEPYSFAIQATQTMEDLLNEGVIRVLRKPFALSVLCDTLCAVLA